MRRSFLARSLVDIHWCLAIIFAPRRLHYLHHCLFSLDVSIRLYTVKPLPAGAYEIEASRFARELFEYYEYCVVNDPTKLDEIRAWTATILCVSRASPR